MHHNVNAIKFLRTSHYSSTICLWAMISQRRCRLGALIDISIPWNFRLTSTICLKGIVPSHWRSQGPRQRMAGWQIPASEARLLVRGQSCGLLSQSATRCLKWDTASLPQAAMQWLHGQDWQIKRLIVLVLLLEKLCASSSLAWVASWWTAFGFKPKISLQMQDSNARFKEDFSQYFSPSWKQMKSGESCKIVKDRAEGLLHGTNARLGDW